MSFEKTKNKLKSRGKGCTFLNHEGLLLSDANLAILFALVKEIRFHERWLNSQTVYTSDHYKGRYCSI